MKVSLMDGGLSLFLLGSRPPTHASTNPLSHAGLDVGVTDINPFATGDAYMRQLFNCLQWYAGSERVKR